MKVPFLDITSQFSIIKEEIIKDIEDIFSKCSFIGGEYVDRFEDEMESYLGVKHVITCGNGTDALVLALRACGVGYGDEVITTSFSFFATAEAIASLGAVPVFADIRENDYLIDVYTIERLISDKTKAILPVQIFGACCDMDRIMQIARKHGLKVIEDDAQAIGSKYKGRYAGTLADIGCFSFYPTKNLGGAGDGGMCTTNSDELAINLESLREHGAGKKGAYAYRNMYGMDADVSLEEEKTKLYNPYKYYNFLVGYNSRLDAIQAAVLSSKLKMLESYNGARKNIALMYYQGIKNKSCLPYYEDYTEPCFHQFTIRVDDKIGINRYLIDNGVGTGTFYPIPLHKQIAFSFLKSYNLPVSEKVCNQTICLPIYFGMTEEQVNYVIDLVNSALEV